MHHFHSNIPIYKIKQISNKCRYNNVLSAQFNYEDPSGNSNNDRLFYLVGEILNTVDDYTIIDFIFPGEFEPNISSSVKLIVNVKDIELASKVKTQVGIYMSVIYMQHGRTCTPLTISIVNSTIIYYKHNNQCFIPHIGTLDQKDTNTPSHLAIGDLFGFYHIYNDENNLNSDYNHIVRGRKWKFDDFCATYMSSPNIPCHYNGQPMP